MRLGFTLLELLLALAILATLTAVAVPSAGRSFRKMGLRDAASTLAGNIRFAQAKAINDSAAVRVVFDAVANEYHLEQAAGPIEQGKFEPLADFAGQTFKLPRGVKFQSVDLFADDGVTPAEGLLFLPDGRGGRGKIALAGSEGGYQIELTGRLGQVSRTEIAAAEVGH